MRLKRFRNQQDTSLQEQEISQKQLLSQVGLDSCYLGNYKISVSISNYTFIRIIYLALYFKSNIGENCQADQIIDTEDTCKVAANVLGLSYVRVRPNSNSYCPAGCHWPSSNSDVAFFNVLTDPSETYPEHFGVKGGLCKRTLHSNLTKSNDLS